MSTLGEVILKGTYADLPAAGIPGRLYFATDTFQLLRDNGTSWDSIMYPLTVGFSVIAGSVGNDVAPMLVAPRSATVSRCVVVVKASDATTALTFRINKNGADVFSTDPTMAANTASGTVTTFTSVASAPLLVNLNDVFTLDITSGTSNWQFTAILT